jgi:RNA polymerase sigma factor (sigma-70 family)
LDLEARDELVLRNRKLVVHLASEFVVSAERACIDFDDLIASGLLGLIRAADRWKPEKGRFTSYCRRHVRGQIRRQFKILRPLVTGLDLSYVPDHRASHVPSLEPMYGVRSWEPSSPCPHPHDDPHFGPFFCGKCHRSDWDLHIDLQLSARDLNPRRRPRRIAAVIPMPELPETRKQKRFRLFGATPVAV